MKQFSSFSDYQSKIKKIIITEQEIQEAVQKTAKMIDGLYDGTPILLVGILKGSFLFMADVCKAVSVPAEIAFITANSYFGGVVSSGDVAITADIKQNVRDYHVVILEDIIDTGRTLSHIAQMIKERHPKSFRVITLLNKPSRRVVDFEADVSLFVIPDCFVVGYGLDHAEYYRNLPYLAEYGDA